MLCIPSITELPALIVALLLLPITVELLLVLSEDALIPIEIELSPSFFALYPTETECHPLDSVSPPNAIVLIF